MRSDAWKESRTESASAERERINARNLAIDRAETAVIEAAEKWAIDRRDDDQPDEEFGETCDALDAAVAHLRSVRESK